jgi:hypothetical protein
MITIRSGKVLLCLLCLFALNPRIYAVSGDTDTSENPYQAIWQRNAFDLKPAADDSAQTHEDTVAPPNVQLTGITSILGRKQALFTVQPSQIPGKPAGSLYSCILAEGERKGGVEVLEINMKTAKVRIKNDGIVSTIALQTNKPPAAPNAPPRIGPIQGMPRAMGGMPPQFLNQGLPPNSPAPAQSPAPDAQSFSPSAYAQPAYATGLVAGYTPPSTTPTSAPNSQNSGNADAQNPAPAPAVNRNVQPQVPPDIAALLNAAEEAARQGGLTPPPLPAYAVPTTGYTMQNGRLTPPPPNFPTPPPLPANIASAMGK